MRHGQLLERKSQYKFRSQEVSMQGQLILFLLSLTLVASSPIGGFLNLEDLEDSNYDIVIDQKQNGTQNFRIRVNGLSIALPADEDEGNNSPSQEMDIAALLGLQSPSSSTGSSQPSSLVTSGNNDFSDLAALFDWKKKSNELKKSTDTQERSKDIATNTQITGDSKDALKNYAKNTNKRYKLLVGEKYIIPLIQFLKRNSDDEI